MTILDLLGHCRAEIVAACKAYYFPDGGDEDTYDHQFEAIADAVLKSPAHQQLQGAVAALDEAITTLGLLRGYVEIDSEPWNAINACQRSLMQARGQ